MNHLRKYTKLYLFGLLILFACPPTIFGYRKAKIANAAANDSKTAFELRNSLSSFYSEYQRFPNPTVSNSEFLTLKSNAEFIEILSGADTGKAIEENPRGIAFFYRRNDKQIAANYLPGGQIKENLQGPVRDSYGNLFRIRAVEFGRPMLSPIDNDLISEGIIVWTAGRDGDFSTWHDNIKTW